jgi:cytochrome c-type biogenesis protein CcmH/NrfG
MTTSLIAFLLTLTAVVIAVSPLLRKRANLPLGTGVEDGSPVRRWQEEKDRLTGQLRDNDLALAEGRVDAAQHSSIAARLAGEAEHALSRLREVRGALTPAYPATPRSARWWTVALVAGLVMAAAYGVHSFASLGDIDMTRSAHGDEAPAADAGGTDAAPAGMPTGADGAPDIGAMVARLEGRIEGGDYTPEDVAMLLRSYRVLKREKDSAALLDKAAAKFPGDPQIGLAFIDAALSGTDETRLGRAERMVSELLAAQPSLAEARWYHSLFLIRKGELDVARKELRALEPMVADNPQAAEAVRTLLARIDIPQHDQTQPAK